MNLDVVVQKVCYPAPPADGRPDGPTWYILSTDRCMAKGELAWRPFDGERLTLSGAWSVYRGNREFKFLAAVPNVPIDARDALHYAAERTLGIGPALEQAIWDARGGEWPNLSPGEVKRLDGELYLRFRETCDTLSREREKSEAIAWLIGRGATVKVASLAWEAWGLQTRGIVTNDPYRLDELPGYGFSYVDKSIRAAFSIGDGDPRRIRAAIRAAMSKFGDEGHTAVAWTLLRDRANEVLGGIWGPALCDHADAMVRQGLLRPFSPQDWSDVRRHARAMSLLGFTSKAPAHVRLSLSCDANAADEIWTFASLSRPRQSTANDADATPFDDEPPQVAAAGGPITLDASQRQAIAVAVDARLSIITGGAGTGKTTIIREIARAVHSPTLCAFAGKAAARLREATGMPASTIHRALGFNGRRFTTPTLSGRTIIIDESSMLDESLLAEIIQRSPDRLVLVGDESQLPPVGRGQPFHDLIRLRPDLVCRLTTCYRQTEAVFRAASMIREGRMPPLHLASPSERWDVIPVGDPARTEDAILAMVRDGRLDFAYDILLTPRNKTSRRNDDDEHEKPDHAPCTTASLNQRIREIVNPSHGDRVVDTGDRVICVKNFPDADVWNGTTGTVHAVDDAGQIWVRTDLPVLDVDGHPTDMVLFDREMRPHLQLAYALTVHKAQGSQYRNVVFVSLLRDTALLLDRALAYTAVTRAKSSCTVIGQPRAFQRALAEVEVRTTALQEVAAESSRLQAQEKSA